MARLEGDSGHQLQSMRSELDQALQRLRAYELLEDEIDAAVVRTAAMSGVKNPESFIPSISGNIDKNNNNNTNNNNQSNSSSINDINSRYRGYKQSFLRGHTKSIGLIEISEKEMLMITGKSHSIQNTV